MLNLRALILAQRRLMILLRSLTFDLRCLTLG